MAVKTGFGDADAVPKINYETCKACGMCAKLCGGEPLVFRDGKVAFATDPMWGCMGCGQCVAVCPTGSVTVTGRNMLPEDRLPLPPKEDRATPEQLGALLLARRSIRRFTEREVERDQVERILELASTAPMGLPPSDVEVLVFHGREKVREFSWDLIALYESWQWMFKPIALTFMRPFMSRVDHDMFASFLKPFVNYIVEERHQDRDALLYGAPLAFLFHASPYADPADVTIVATYAMLAAESLGLGTIMIGAVSPALVRDKKLMAKYGIPKGNKLGLVLLVGHPKHRFHSALKRRFASVTYR